MYILVTLAVLARAQILTWGACATYKDDCGAGCMNEIKSRWADIRSWEFWSSESDGSVDRILNPPPYFKVSNIYFFAFLYLFSSSGRISVILLYLMQVIGVPFVPVEADHESPCMFHLASSYFCRFWPCPHLIDILICPPFQAFVKSS